MTTDTQFTIDIRAYKGMPSNFRSLVDDPRSEIAQARENIFTDADTSTWETATARLALPADTDFLAVRIGAVEDVVNDNAAPEFDGHFADNVQVVIETSPLTVQFADVSPSQRLENVERIDIVFGDPVLGFDLSDLELFRDGSTRSLSGSATLTSADTRAWTLGNLGSLTDQPGDYRLELNAIDVAIEDLSGNKLLTNAAVTWTNIRQAGDANTDGRFDQLDIVVILGAAKYLTGQLALWGEGDFTADKVFDQRDLVAALQTGNYLQGPYATFSGLVKRSRELDAMDDVFARTRI